MPGKVAGHFMLIELSFSNFITADLLPGTFES